MGIQTLKLNKNLAEQLEKADIVDGVLMVYGPRHEPITGPLPPRPPMQTEVITPEQLQVINAQVAQQKLDAVNNPGPRQYFKAPTNNVGTGAIVAIALVIGGAYMLLNKKKTTPKKVKL